MTFDDLKKLELLQTRSIAEACKDENTHAYIVDCLKRFYCGDYGKICKEDTELNNEDLKRGEGHILARYPAKGKLEGDIYIEAHFDNEVPGLDANHIMIMYPEER